MGNVYANIISKCLNQFQNSYFSFNLLKLIVLTKKTSFNSVIQETISKNSSQQFF